MIDFVIPVRDREPKRIQRCVDSLKSKITGSILVIDYGSKKQFTIKGAQVWRVNTKNVWNKSHALNLGIRDRIRNSKSKFIAAIDCDIILPPRFLEEAERHLFPDSFIISRKVKRIEEFYFEESYLSQLENSFPWAEGAINYTGAVGGIQIFGKDWIEKVRGYDEQLVYWGGMDSDLLERATRSSLKIIDLNMTLIHQEHSKRKEKNLPLKEQKRAEDMRALRRAYLNRKEYDRVIVCPERWGEGRPNQGFKFQGNEELETPSSEKEFIENNIKNLIKEKISVEDLKKRIKEKLQIS